MENPWERELELFDTHWSGCSLGFLYLPEFQILEIQSDTLKFIISKIYTFLRLQAIHVCGLFPPFQMCRRVGKTKGRGPAWFARSERGLAVGRRVCVRAPLSLREPSPVSDLDLFP